MNTSKAVDIFLSLITATLVIGLVLPGRQTTGVARELFQGTSGVLKTVQGR